MMNSMMYSTEQIAAAYAQLGLQNGDSVYLTGNMGGLGFHESKTKAGALEGHWSGLQQVIGQAGTVAVPTHTFSYCNTDRPFDLKSAPSERGPLTEFVRQLPGSVRQRHPFASLTAVGAGAAAVCGSCSRHAYGPHTPFDRLLQADAWSISIAMPPRTTCSLVHHVEMAMGVPYRYTKEFMHPMVTGPGEVRVEPFYLYVTYKGLPLLRDVNEKFFALPALREHVREVPLGMGRLWAYRMRVFETAVREAMSQDIYGWLKEPPVERPYQS